MPSRSTPTPSIRLDRRANVDEISAGPPDGPNSKGLRTTIRAFKADLCPKSPNLAVKSATLRACGKSSSSGQRSHHPRQHQRVYITYLKEQLRNPDAIIADLSE